LPRPAVLIVDPDPERRHALGRGLTEAGYEAVPAAGADEGERFARALGPAVIVAATGLDRFGDGAILEQLEPVPTLVLLGGDPAEERGLPGEVVFLVARGLPAEELVRRIRLVLVGREVGLDADPRLEELVGDLALRPLLELLRSLRRVRVTGTVRLEHGAIHLEDGEVLAAEARPVRGIKAFCRLARLSEEPFRVRLGSPGVEREIFEPWNALTVAAIKDAVGEFPDPQARLRVEMAEGFFDRSFTEVEQEIVRLAHGSASVGELLDIVPVPDGEVVQQLLGLERRGIVVRRSPRPAVRVITDSTADLPAVLIREHGIAVVPLQVRFGDKVFHDRVDLHPGEFYRRLEEEARAPTSSPPSPEVFATAYRRYLDRCDLISVHLSSKMSKTWEHARTAASAELERAAGERLEDRPPQLRVLDSRQISLGLGFLALFAARMAARGESSQAIGQHLEEMRRRISLLFVVDTLEYLARGGRIGKASAFVGGLFRIKPILGLVDGEVAPIDRVRGRRATIPRLVELLRERLDPGRPVIVGITHARAPAWAERLRQVLTAELEVRELIVGETGPVIGTHVGPGAFSVTTFQPTDDEAELVAPLGPSHGGSAPMPDRSTPRSPPKKDSPK
jgi:DegV family protein with EDD domain